MGEFAVIDVASWSVSLTGVYHWFEFGLRFTYFRHLASLGAVLTVVALAAEPFTQQCVVYRTRSIPDGTGIASIRHSNVYSAYMAISDGKILRCILSILLCPL